VKKIWIADATPIILLAKVGRLDLLTLLADEVFLPSPVVREIKRGDPSDMARQAIESGWGTLVAVRYIPVAVRSQSRLDPGEASVLALALKQPSCTVVLDDNAGRRAAKQLGLSCIGTLGVLLLAKKAGHIPAVKPIIQDLIRVGQYLDNILIVGVLTGVDEIWP
jgi:predicted nucleic acid-binding protein